MVNIIKAKHEVTKIINDVLFRLEKQEIEGIDVNTLVKKLILKYPVSILFVIKTLKFIIASNPIFNIEGDLNDLQTSPVIFLDKSKLEKNVFKDLQQETLNVEKTEDEHKMEDE